MATFRSFSVLFMMVIYISSAIWKLPSQHTMNAPTLMLTSKRSNFIESNKKKKVYSSTTFCRREERKSKLKENEKIDFIVKSNQIDFNPNLLVEGKTSEKGRSERIIN